MNKASTLEVSQTDWPRITTMAEDEIDLSDIPEVTEEQMKRAVLRVNGKRVKQRAIVILLDPDVAAAFPTAEAVNEALRLLMKVAQIALPKEAVSISPVS